MTDGKQRAAYMEVDTFLEKLGLSTDEIENARRQGIRNGTPIEAELIASGRLTETHLYAGVARHFGLRFLHELPVEQMEDKQGIDELLSDPRAVSIRPQNSPALKVIVPPLSGFARLVEWTANAQIRSRLLITTPSAMRRAVWATGRHRRVRESINRLFDNTPEMSARFTLLGRQGFMVGIAAASLMAAILIEPKIVLATLHLLLSFLYLATILLRLVGFAYARKTGPVHNIRSGTQPLPIYSVLIALYREAPVVPQLVAALKRLDWPASKLDIKLVCEEDDEETLAAIQSISLPPMVEVVIVPQSVPRTKPKALTYALAGARGEFVTIYDAEDRPHPAQLRQAYGRFLSCGPELACLQAPLVVTNARDGWLTALFALEYTALFRTFLPFLARLNLPLPLGGTSNHFRKSALKAVGGWDPFNVTEDADLGLRLHRLGFKTGVLDLPTLEEAPSSLSVWLGQRRRWFKGWLQTYLVSMRNPVDLARQLGLWGFLCYQLTIGGMVISSLFHPFLLASILSLAYRAATGTLPEVISREGLLLGADMFNLMAGYSILLLAGQVVARAGPRQLPGRELLLIPVYWMLLSFAAWRALWELNHNPHFWQKTPHTPVRRHKGPE